MKLHMNKLNKLSKRLNKIIEEKVQINQFKYHHNKY